MGGKRWKDRKDGRYLRDIDPAHKVFPYIMPRRTEAEVFMTQSVDVTNLWEYIDGKKAAGDNNVTVFSSTVAAMVRTCALRPALNNFVKGYRFYRRNEISVGFVSKQGLSDDAPTHLITMVFDPEDDIFSVSKKLYDRVNATKEGDAMPGDDVVGRFARKPRWFLRLAVRVLSFLDFHGWMPESVSNGDPNYASVFLSNLGSIGCDAPLHHLNEWGTNSIFMCMGRKYDKAVARDGEVVIRPHIDFTFTVDERIADGIYLSRSMEIFKRLLEDPGALETPLEADEVE